MDKYSSIITNIGEERIAHAIALGEKLNIATMSVGDGMGTIPVPSPDQTTLLNEVYRAPLNSLKIYPGRNNTIMAEMVIPSDEGGYWIREAALYSESGEMLAVCSVPESYKPKLVEGSGRVQTIRIMLVVSSTEHITLLVDPTVVMATTQYVDEQIIILGNSVSENLHQMDEQITALGNVTAENLRKHERSRNHPDATLTEKGFTQLSSKIDSDSNELAATPAAIKAAIAAAVRQAWELSNPKGISLFFFENVNPNALWPWSTWEYTGEDRTVRLAKQDGSNVGKLGGSDTVTIARANLPNEQLNISGGTSQQAAQTLSTKQAGKHAHKGGMRGPGAEYDSTISGTDNDGRHTLNYTSEDGDHGHDVDIPAHVHTVSGKTDALGQGQAISIVEKHVLQMCWHRVA